LITLIGLPGSGKSTVGRQLARRLSALFLDSDHVIEQRLGCSIREFFEREGEAAFRDVEAQVISDLVAAHGETQSKTHAQAHGRTHDVIQNLTRASTQTDPRDAPAPSAHTNLPSEKPVVLSTGGGAVLRAANREVLRAAGWVVYLHASPEDLYKRLRHDQSRPLLQGTDPLQKLRDLYAQRDPLYRETANFQLETGRPSVATLVNMVAMQLDLAGALAQPSSDQTAGHQS
jgi:shikimate kinase